MQFQRSRKLGSGTISVNIFKTPNPAIARICKNIGSVCRFRESSAVRWVAGAKISQQLKWCLMHET
jgi:hypothetical protein